MLPTMRDCARPLMFALVVGWAAGCGAEMPPAPRFDAPAPPARSPTPAPSGASVAMSAGGTSSRGLHVDGNRLVAGNQTVRLLGVSHSGTETHCTEDHGDIFQGPSGESLVTPMLAWKLNAVRVPLNEDCWLGINGVPPVTSGKAYQTAIATFVKMLRAHNLYVVLDLHWSAPGTTLARTQQPMADEDHSPAFWTSVAGAFKDDTGVLFELYNEPFIDPANADTPDVWACWLAGCTIKAAPPIGASWKSAGMQSMVDAVRGTGARNIIVLGGLHYANDLSGLLAHMPSDPLKQLTAGFHVYNFSWPCTTAACWTSTIGSVASQIPVITGELGENDCAHGFIDAFTEWADPHGLSYFGWAWNVWDCRTGPALITDYEGTPTALGAGYKAHLAVVRQ
jgi:endoglucanase